LHPLLLLREFHPRTTSSFDTGGGGGGGGEFLHVEWYNLSQLSRKQKRAARSRTHIFMSSRTLLNYDCANIVPRAARVANIITWRGL